MAGSGYIRVPFPNNALNQGTGIAIPQGNMTFSMWFKTNAAVLGGLQVVEGNATWGSGYDRVVGNGTGSTLQYNAWNEVNMSGVATVNDGNWHLMTYVLDETSGFLTYIDGNPDASSATATTNCGVGCSGFNWAVGVLDWPLRQRPFQRRLLHRPHRRRAHVQPRPFADRGDAALQRDEVAPRTAGSEPPPVKSNESEAQRGSATRNEGGPGGASGSEPPPVKSNESERSVALPRGARARGVRAAASHPP